MFGSSVEPDLLATITSVSARFSLSRTAFTCAGLVESTMCRVGKVALLPKGHGQHLGAKAGTAHAQQQDVLEAAGLHVRAQLGQIAQYRLCWRSTMSIQPSQFSSPSRVHRLGSFCQKRSTLLLACQSAAARSTAPRSS